MRILHLVESLERGGLERVVVNLARAQRAAGHEVAVCCLFRLGALADELVALGMRVTSGEKTAGFDISAIRHVRAELKRLGATVLHTHNAVSNYYGALAAICLPVRVINTRHGMGFVGAPGMKERLYRLSLLRTASVAAVCSAGLRHLVESGVVPRRRARVVRNGIEVDHFVAADGAARAAGRCLLGLPGDAYVVGTVGRLNWAKNHALLIDSFALLVGPCPESRLVIVGDGALRDALTDQVERLGLAHRVLLTGDRDDVRALLPAMDVFAMTSTTEGYSMALLEAAAAGLPVVATDVGGNSEIVQDGITGCVMVAPSPEAFSRSLEDLAKNVTLRTQMGAKARSWVEQQGSLSSMVNAYEELYAGGLAGEEMENVVI